MKSEHFDLRDGAAASMFNPPQRRDQKEVRVKGLDALDGVQQSFWRPQISCLGRSQRCWYEVLVEHVNVNHIFIITQLHIIHI